MSDVDDFLAAPDAPGPGSTEFTYADEDNAIRSAKAYAADSLNTGAHDLRKLVKTVEMMCDPAEFQVASISCTGWAWFATHSGLTCHAHQSRVVQACYCDTHAVLCPSFVKAPLVPRSILSTCV